jgi:nucleoside-diphosphate-sugar epimerase
VTVLITGGTGLVGRHVIAALSGRSEPVRAVARSDRAMAELREAGAEPVRGDLTDAASLREAARGARALVHAGAVVLSRRGWAHYHATNVQATETVARAAAAEGARLVYLSSVAVYGRKTTYDGGAASVTEDYGLDRPIYPGDHYARSKREAELTVWRVAGETSLSAVALRPCVIYGEHDRTFSRRVARALSHGIAPLIGGGRNPLSVVYAGNVAAAVLCALDRPEARGAFNIANDGTLTTREFVAAFAEGMGVRLRRFAIPRTLAWWGALGVDGLVRLLRPGAPMATLKTAVQFLANPNPYVSLRAEHELGWRPVVPARDAVFRTARWFRAALADPPLAAPTS